MISTIQPISIKETGIDALNLMSDYNLRHLAVVNDDKFLGVISEDEILDHDIYQPIENYKINFKKISINDRNHLYDALQLATDHRLSFLPVIGANGSYLGGITLNDLIQKFGNAASFTEHGSVIVLQMKRQDYSVANISRVIEAENATILSVLISELNEELMEVTIKVNRQDISRIVATLERFEYYVKATFQEEREVKDDLQERYESLLNYLNV